MSIRVGQKWQYVQRLRKGEHVVGEYVLVHYGNPSMVALINTLTGELHGPKVCVKDPGNISPQEVDSIFHICQACAPGMSWRRIYDPVVIITINKGIANVVQKPKGVKVITYDYDIGDSPEPCLAEYYEAQDEIFEYEPTGLEPIEED